MQQTLALTPKQIDALEKAFLKKVDERIALRRKLDRLDAKLHHLIDVAEEDDATILALSDRVEDVRARKNVARALMLLDMRRILTPGQRVLLRNVHASNSNNASRPRPH